MITKIALAIRIYLLWLVALMASPSYAIDQARCPPAIEKPTSEAMQFAMQNARDHGFLWRISKDGHTSFLYGTMHIAKLEWGFPGPDIMEALRATDTLALELDIFDPDIQKRMAEGFAKLHSIALPDRLAKRIRRQADILCVPFDSIAKLPPEIQLMSLELFVGRWDGLDPSYAIDGILSAIGHGAKKTVISLETPESQIKIIKMHNLKETKAIVDIELSDLETERARTMVNRISRSWANSDYADLERFKEWCACLDTNIERDLMKRVLDDRNPNLASRIDALHLGGKRVFAAVGSLHMFGPMGLPALMAQRGYLVEQLLQDTSIQPSSSPAATVQGSEN